MSEGNNAYESPELTEIGSVTEITGSDKTGSGDGGGMAPLGG